jgi:hypothetical protein
LTGQYFNNPIIFKAVRFSFFFKNFIPQWLKPLKNRGIAGLGYALLCAVQGTVFMGAEPIVVHKCNRRGDFKKIAQIWLFPFARCGTF